VVGVVGVVVVYCFHYCCVLLTFGVIVVVGGVIAGCITVPGSVDGVVVVGVVVDIGAVVAAIHYCLRLCCYRFC